MSRTRWKGERRRRKTKEKAGGKGKGHRKVIGHENNWGGGE